MARMPSFSANSRSSLRVVFPSVMTPSTSTTPTRSPRAKPPLLPEYTAAQARARKAKRQRKRPPKTRPMTHAARRSMSDGLLADPAAAEYLVTPVEDGGLTWRHCPQRDLAVHGEAALLVDHPGRRAPVAMAHAHLEDLLLGGRPVGPGGLEDGEGRPFQVPGRTHHHPVVRGVDLLHVEGRGGGDAQSAALADGGAVRAGVPGEDPATGVHHVALGLRASHPLDEAGVVAVGHEADLHALWLAAGGEAVPCGDGADLGLGQRAHRELELRQRLLSESE